MLDVAITIDNYVPADRYVINIYREGSAIPVKTLELLANEGPTGVIKLLPDGYNYDAEVIHWCNGTVFKKLRKRVFTLEQKGCACPAGFVANPDNTRCYRIFTEPATATLTPYAVGAGPNNTAYNDAGARVYAPGYTSDGRGPSLWDSGGANPYWASQSLTTQGRLNLAGVWNNASSSLPLNTWIGFSKKIVVPVSKVYYLGMAGDNYVRFSVNGTVIIDQRNAGGASNYNFNYWHIFPVFLNAGDNFLRLEGYNDSSIGCFAAEIYNCDLQAIQNVTTGTEATLNRIFTTLGQTDFDTEYSCRAGWELDVSGVDPVCRMVEYQSCQ
jgi:hypothetical protein